MPTAVYQHMCEDKFVFIILNLNLTLNILSHVEGTAEASSHPPSNSSAAPAAPTEGGQTSPPQAPAFVQLPGAPESEVSITFAAMLRGVVGPETAAAAQEYLDTWGADPVPMIEGPSVVVGGEEKPAQQAEFLTVDESGFDMRVGPRTAVRKRMHLPIKQSGEFAGKGVKDADWELGEAPLQKRAIGRPPGSGATVKGVVSGSKAMSAGPLPPGWRCLWRRRTADKSGKLYRVRTSCTLPPSTSTKQMNNIE